MKFAVLSDAHGNLPALTAVLDDIERWGADQVIVNGDLVNRGPCSLECLRLLQARFPGSRCIKGNHEAYVLACADDPLPADDPTRELRLFAHWTYRQLGDAVADIAAWDEHYDLDAPVGASLHITHGSRLGNRAGISASTPEDELAEKLGPARDLFVGSHTHKPLIKRFNGTLVVNTGSVGQPLDGDERAAYGRFTLADGRWRAEIARVPFDKARALRDMDESGFLEQGGAITRLIRLELEQARMHVGPWMREYLPRVKAGEISVAAGVDSYLRSTKV
ncbi:diadenosine tetraphosphatase [Thiohalobacter thiocyanaticus]|uniref:Diadenosine tetraphosphatase n=1 Tax=Thiohalobacter thiocyanaticus TaxID=585455 RepID=A0A1Z4VP73_9GAMM|nr:metallophosphoesterase family protein [Thiohalobacter thiocyanaticus]BAZ93138.1 diadenosine tetraphosphatase [Thiohalobacter thiocyanaticus]